MLLLLPPHARALLLGHTQQALSSRSSSSSSSSRCSCRALRSSGGLPTEGERRRSLAIRQKLLQDLDAQVPNLARCHFIEYFVLRCARSS